MQEIREREQQKEKVMSADSMLKQSCDHCGLTVEVYGGTSKPSTLCLNCGKSKARKGCKCFECGRCKCFECGRLSREAEEASKSWRIANCHPQWMMEAAYMGGDGDEANENEGDYDDCSSYDGNSKECSSDDDLVATTVIMEVDENGHIVDEEIVLSKSRGELEKLQGGANGLTGSGEVDDDYFKNGADKEGLSESGREMMNLLKKFHWLNESNAVDDDGNGNDDENEHETDNDDDDDGVLRKTGEVDDANKRNMEDELFAVFFALRRNDIKGEPVDRSTTLKPTTSAAVHEATSSPNCPSTFEDCMNERSAGDLQSRQNGQHHLIDKY